MPASLADTYKDVFDGLPPPDLGATRRERLQYILRKNRRVQEWALEVTARLMAGESYKERQNEIKSVTSVGQVLFRGIAAEAKALGVDRVQEGEDVGKKAGEFGQWMNLKTKCPHCGTVFTLADGGDMADGATPSGGG
jgi:hypothetical protein